MKSKLFTILFGLTLATGAAQAAEYTLAWADEFNKDGVPDRGNWTYEHGFVRNHELQWYQPENAFCSNGFLIIEGRRERKPNPNYKAGSRHWKTARKEAEYTSACLTTQGLQSWQYGRFEMRARLDTSAGLWPAFWTLGVSGEWPGNGEIDIMEYYQSKLLANVALATKKRYTPQWDSVSTPRSEFPADWSEQFHVWRMDWDHESIRLYVDDRLLNETRLADTFNPAGHPIENPFRQPHYILVNLAIGGEQGGDPSETAFPSRYEIDYIRVYQKHGPQG